MAVAAFLYYARLGSDFDAAAVVWNYQHIMEPETKAFAKPFFEVIEAVEPLDAHTVKFILKYPTQTFLPTLAIYRVGLLIKSPTAYQKWGKQEAHLHPTGTGAFKLVKWEPNHIIVLEKNPDYFEAGKPYVDEIRWLVIPQESTFFAGFQTRQIEEPGELALELHPVTSSR